MRPYPGKHLHLFTASRGDEYHFRPDRRPYSCRTFPHALDMAAAASDDVGFDLLGVAGLGTILVGLSPENANVLFHLIGALNIPAGNAATILLGLAIWGQHWGSRIAPRRAEEERGDMLFVAERRRSRRAPTRDPRGESAASGAIELAWFSVLSGVIGLLGLVVGPVLVILTGHGGGLAERIALYPLIIWLIVFGFAILTTKVRTRDNPGPTPSGETAAQESEFAAKPR